MLLEPGTLAPDFTSSDQHGNFFTLSSLRGQKVALYFYPKDDTPGCTAQACNLRDNESQLAAQGIKVVGVSTDDAASHAKFAQKYDLAFPLVADADKAIVQAYGVWQEKKTTAKRIGARCAPRFCWMRTALSPALSSGPTRRSTPRSS